MSEGKKALENSAAAKGVLRTGGTLKDLFSWGNKFGEQNYGNVFNRAASIYDTNRNNAASNYATNYGVSRDTFDRNYKGSTDAYATNTGNLYDTYDRKFAGDVAAFNPKFQAAQLTFEDLYKRWKDKLNATTTIATAGAY